MKIEAESVLVKTELEMEEKEESEAEFHPHDPRRGLFDPVRQRDDKLSMECVDLMMEMSLEGRQWFIKRCAAFHL